MYMNVGAHRNTHPIHVPEILILLLVFLAYGGLLTWGSLRGFPQSMSPGTVMPFLSDKPVGEDGYCMLTLAWNMAEGRGPVVNLHQPTAGFQPLATLGYAILAKLIQVTGGDKWTLVRGVILLGCLTQVTFAWVVASISAQASRDPETRAAAHLIGFAASLFNQTLFRLFTYGLETGLYLLLIAILFRYTLSRSALSGMSQRAWIVWGLLAGLTSLARIDFLLPLACLLGFFLFDRVPIRSIASAALASGFMIAPWFLWVHSVSGTWIQSSASVEMRWIDASSVLPRLLALMKAVIEHGTPWASTWGRIDMAAGAFLTLGMVVLFLRREASIKESVTERSMGPGGAFLISFTLLSLIYFTLSWATHFYVRYLAPLSLIVTLLGSVWTARALKGHWLWIQRGLLSGLCLCFFFFTYADLHNGRVECSLSVSAGTLQNRCLGIGKIGAFQSGIAGYFCPNVINLDGKVNAKALAAIRSGRLDEYLDQEGIHVLMDWPSYIAGHLPQKYLSSQWRLSSLSIPNGQALCIVRKDSKEARILP